MNKEAYPYIFVLIILGMIAAIWYMNEKLKIFEWFTGIKPNVP